jgi:hypothetical protein
VSREDFVAVAARLFSIYVIFITLRAIPASIGALSQPDGGGWLLVYVLATAIFLAFAAFLWFFPLTVARKLLPVMREARSETALDGSVALSIGITLIGLWFLANAVVDAAYWLTLIASVAKTDPPGFEWTTEQIASMGSTIVELAISLALVLGSTGVKKLIHRYRYGESTDAR